MTDDEKQCRERFEAWYRGRYPNQSLELGKSGDYKFRHALDRLDGWQAAWNALEEWRPIEDLPPKTQIYIRADGTISIRLKLHGGDWADAVTGRTLQEAIAQLPSDLTPAPECD